MGFAKTEAAGKCKTLKEIADKYPTLTEVVDADKRVGKVSVVVGVVENAWVFDDVQKHTQCFPGCA